ncbi:hypothetical protein [Cryobacterium sp. PAMC25264]|uniref:hypothetical protein n=1 Tax=Cryobacterium sp. PAMC25264 TaxID=2861288 RepID=UPI001C62AB46|nr:hypothetical protein [Cryobacterium sp. PAMC25264]QYF73378.1 hypothetical protein KY500_16920 [Cryobacterium sp. PAMC25264]
MGPSQHECGIVKEETRDLINLINRIYEVLHNDGDVVKIAARTARDVARRDETARRDRAE